MNKLKSLAGQTAIYGVSSILGRIINYFLVGLHTQVFLAGQMGEVSVLYGYTALVLITITFGMETTYFRFATQSNSKKAYHVASTSIAIVSLLIAFTIYWQAPFILTLLPQGMDSTQLITIIRLLAVILFIDGITAIPFALLRIENRPIKFAVAKLVAIFANITLQLLFLLVFPSILNGDYLTGFQSFVSGIYDGQLGIQYIFIANVLSNSLLFIILWKEFASFRVSIDWAVLKPMLLYALPLLLTGILGWATNFLDQIVVATWSANDGLANQGIYSQTFKLGAIMMLVIQAFRYAAEPFFFSQAKDPNAPELYAKTLHYFTLLSLLIMLAVCANIDLIAHVLLRNQAFRVALYLVPVIMFGKLLFGVYINLSIWFKLTDKTMYGFYFTLIGATVTILGNYLLIPIIGYLGSAITIILTFGVMSTVCYFIGKNHFKIPYRFTPLFVYSLAIIGIIYLTFIIEFSNLYVDSIFNISVPIIIAMVMYRIERHKLYRLVD